MKEVKKVLLELERYTAVAKETLRTRLRGLTKEEMVAQINELDLSDRSLIFLCQVIALETEDYEICSAVQAIRKERKLLQAGVEKTLS